MVVKRDMTEGRNQLTAVSCILAHGSMEKVVDFDRRDSASEFSAQITNALGQILVSV